MHLGITLRVTALLAAACTVIGVGTAAASHVAAERAVVSAQKPAYDLAVDQVISRAGGALHLAQLASDALDGARAALDASEGKVLDGDTSRTALDDAIRKDTFLVQTAGAEQRIVRGKAEAKPKAGQWGPDYVGATAELGRLSFPAAEHLAGIPAQLSKLEADLTAATAAWQAEQERIAAAKAAAEAAYRASHTLDVWTTGWSPEIDACRGAVDITPRTGLTTPLLALHSYCGGTALAKDVGSVITLTGLYTGQWKSLGLVTTVNAYTQGPEAVPQLPAGQLEIMTCYPNPSSQGIWVFERVG
ncbi:hypothetical protein [Leifsonia sp. fls2-241-R2A-40a]|uniref:hypothetical protein n=1 Tax=Leifsonia sp. fls2-241-R2A-40a TaxID=3040290 RepID=UPI00254C590B|nr:hypothetical protein [Leifsonia sp. fls2-241-R2A-40a]